MLTPAVIVVTGGIGCGKTTVVELFAQMGAGVLDTDQISRDLTAAGGAAVTALHRQFGADCLTPDGALDRQAMRQRVFADDRARQQLEAILHPLILEQVKARLQDMLNYPYILLVVPLLWRDSPYVALAERILLVDCRESLQVARVMQRSALTESEVRTIMRCQPQPELRLQLADDVIDNNGDVAGLQCQVEALHRLYSDL